ncbi:hypothetical protein L0128_11110 [candidate division KSB1 bacterium]|nr:hypothetical protein [candidate division KSB1 bacterium]
MKRKWFRSGLSVVLLISLCFVNCSEKNPVAPEQSPVLPPVASMKIDLAYFQQGGLAKAIANTPKNNFLNAAGRVVFLNAAVVVTMSIPTAVFAAAVSQPMTWDANDRKFHWIYTVTYQQMVFKADLAGWIDAQAGEAVWEMYITNTAEPLKLDHFLYYEGRSKLANTSGWWVIYNASTPTQKNKVLNLDWSVSATESKVVFTNVMAGNAGENDKLTYWVSGVDQKVNFWDNSANAMLEIYWETAKGTGYIIAPDYNNGQKACWDENQNDVTCP